MNETISYHNRVRGSKSEPLTNNSLKRAGVRRQDLPTYTVSPPSIEVEEATISSIEDSFDFDRSFDRSESTFDYSGSIDSEGSYSGSSYEESSYEDSALGGSFDISDYPLDGKAAGAAEPRKKLKCSKERINSRKYLETLVLNAPVSGFTIVKRDRLKSAYHSMLNSLDRYYELSLETIRENKSLIKYLLFCKFPTLLRRRFLPSRHKDLLISCQQTLGEKYCRAFDVEKYPFRWFDRAGLWPNSFVVDLSEDLRC